MKKYLILSFVATLLLSCSLDDGENASFNIEILPIDSVDIPAEFAIGETYPITVTYSRPSNCHVFRDFYYLKNNNERTVAVMTRVFEASDCMDLSDTALTATFNFQVTSNGSYIFKFWQGQDENEEDIFLEIEVPVTN